MSRESATPLEKSHLLEHLLPAVRLILRESGRLMGRGLRIHTCSSYCWPAQFLRRRQSLSSRKTSFQSCFHQPKDYRDGWGGRRFQFSLLEARMRYLLQRLFIVLNRLTGFSPNQSDKCHFSSFLLTFCPEQSCSLLAGPRGRQKGGFTIGPLYRKTLIQSSEIGRSGEPAHWPTPSSTPILSHL